MKKILSLLFIFAMATGMLISCKKEEPPTYTVTFDVQGHGIAPDAISGISSGSTIKEPTTPEEDGFLFCGWFKESDCSNSWDFANDVVTTDITLYAKWDIYIPEGFVDMGVTNASGKPLFWAECNLGATKPEEYGHYFAWAGTTGYKYESSKWVDAKTSWEPSDVFSIDNAPYHSGSEYTKYNNSDLKTTLEATDDAASKENPKWRTPTIEDFNALKDNCYMEWTDNYNNTSVKGLIVYKAKADEDKGLLGTKYGYSTSDAHIFFPAAGLGASTLLYYDGSLGNYWSSTLYPTSHYNACYLNFAPLDVSLTLGGSRYDGFPIRPVYDGK
mgnify:FL=1